MKRRFKARRAIAATVAVGAVAAATVVSVQAASAGEGDGAVQQACVMATLPIPEGYRSTSVTGMSNDGSVIAYVAESPGQDGAGPRQFLYSGGEASEVPMLNDYATIEDVNTAGVGVGWTFISPDYVPYVWRDGELSELPTEQGGSAHAINGKGDIVGSRDRDGVSVPVVWRVGGTGPVDLALPRGYAWGEATGIGNDGTIVGYVKVERDNSGKPKPYVWRTDGTKGFLAMPAGVNLADASAEVTDIKGDWASGWLSAPGASYGGVRWNLANGTAVMTGLGDWVAVSANGTVASHLRNSPVAAYKTGATIVKLPGLIAPADNTSRDNVVAISADGSLLAGDVFIGEYDADEQPLTNAVTWTCELSPEAGASALTISTRTGTSRSARPPLSPEGAADRSVLPLFSARRLPDPQWSATLRGPRRPLRVPQDRIQSHLPVRGGLVRYGSEGAPVTILMPNRLSGNVFGRCCAFELSPSQVSGPGHPERCPGSFSLVRMRSASSSIPNIM